MNADEFDNNKLVGDKEIGQGVFEFDPTDLAADLMQEWSYENDNSEEKYVDNSNTVDKDNVGENLSTLENDNENSEPLPIALRKTCCKNLKDNK